MLDGDPPRANAAVAERVLARLGGLRVEIDAVSVRVDLVDVPSYPGEPRPSSTLTLSGAQHEGRGENVAWTEAAQRAFAHDAAKVVPRGSVAIADLRDHLAARDVEPYTRAAIEAAAIDLALRQQSTSLAGLAGVAARDTRYLVSLGRAADPLPAVRAEVSAWVAAEIKIDVDDAWNAAAVAGLAALGCIRVLDWKGSGATALRERLREAMPDALLEDPPLDDARGATPGSNALCARLAFDQPLLRTADLDRLPAVPVAVNVKPGRMGGVLEAIELVAAASRRDIAVYFGGMFEIGVGRAQLLTLASLLCPDAPNDIAPIARAGAPAPRPPRLPAPRPDAPGFG